MVWNNIEAPDPSTVTMPITALLSGVGAAALTGLIGFYLAPNDPRNDSKPESQQLELGPDEQIRWQETIGAPWLALVGSVLLAAGLLIGWTMHWSAGLVTAGSGALMFLFLKCAVTVDRNGLTVSLAALRLLRIRIPLDDISRVEVEKTVPDQFLGLGYRIVRGGSGVILNHGPTLIITRTSGRWFVAAVGDAATAAGVLNGLLAQKG